MPSFYPSRLKWGFSEWSNWQYGFIRSAPIWSVRSRFERSQFKRVDWIGMNPFMRFSTRQFLLQNSWFQLFHSEKSMRFYHPSRDLALLLASDSFWNLKFCGVVLRTRRFLPKMRYGSPYASWSTYGRILGLVVYVFTWLTTFKKVNGSYNIGLR